MKKSNIINILEEHAPLNLQAEWDFSGIQIESFSEEFSRLAVMLDPTLEGVEKAIELGADVILTHHPLSMSPYHLNKDDSLFRIIHKLISNNIMLYSAHTSLDANFGGFSSWLAKDLALNDVRELDTLEHFGAVGTLPQALTVNELCNMLQKSMPFINKSDFRLSGKSVWQGANALEQRVEKIAFCTGSGSGMYTLAQNAGADIFITGDVKYHTALDISTDISQSSMLLLDVGHFSLEEEMMRRFSNHLQNTLPIEVSFISSRNPFFTLK